MRFAAYKFNPEYIAERCETLKKELAENGIADPFFEFCVKVFSERLRKNPRSYLEYGPYWWELKRILRENGHDFGSVNDEEVRLEYRSESPEVSCVMAEEFREDYLDTFFVGANKFELACDQEEYELYDPDMERAS